MAILISRQESTGAAPNSTPIDLSGRYSVTLPGFLISLIVDGPGVPQGFTPGYNSVAPPALKKACEGRFCVFLRTGWIGIMFFQLMRARFGIGDGGDHPPGRGRVLLVPGIMLVILAIIYFTKDAYEGCAGEAESEPENDGARAVSAVGISERLGGSLALPRLCRINVRFIPCCNSPGFR